MSKKEITPLPEGLVEAFAAKAKYALKESVKSELELLEHEMRVLNTKLMAARNGGAGSVPRLHEEKLRLAKKIEEAKASRSADNTEGDTKTPNVEATVKTPEGTADKKAPARKGDKAAGEPMQKIKEEVEELDESKALLKDYEAMKAQGKKDSSIIDVLMSMPKYKKMSRDQMAKVIGDAKRKGIFKEDVEVTELHMALLEAHGIEKKVAERVKKVFDAMSSEDKAAFMKAYLKNPKAATEHMFSSMKKMAKEEVELEEAMDPVDAKALKGKHSERKDKDIDNDGDVDKSDEYLHKRRQAIKKAIANEEVELEEKLAPHTVRGDTYVGVPDRVVAQAKEKVKKMNPSNASDHTKAMHKALSDMGWEMTVSGKYVKESVELEEQRQPFIVIDTANGNKVVGTASDEKGAKRIISSSERPPMSIKDKSTLKIVKSRKKQHIGHPIQEEVEQIDEVSKKTLSSYIKKAVKDKNAEYNKAERAKSDDKAMDHLSKARKRVKGVDMAHKKMKEDVELDEGYTINHKTFSSAVQHAKAQVEKQGYTIDDDEWDRKVAMGPKKPGTGKTNRYTIDLMKGGKETRRKLQMQVYYDEGRYELNMYIS